MKDLPKSPAATKLSRQLRKSHTAAEHQMWTLLRSRRFVGYKFRRQQPIGQHIADFYCRELKLVIVLDGSGHMENDQVAHDRQREEFLASLGIRVLRFWNNDVLQRPSAVLEKVLSVIGTEKK